MIAQIFCRAGLHLGTTTVRRMLRGEVAPEETPRSRKASGKKLAARYRRHLWHPDLSIVSTSFGLRTSSLPFALPQRWPFCWWVAVVADHYSRRLTGFAIFAKQPTAKDVRAFRARVMRTPRARSRYLVTDQGRQFRAGEFRAWCKSLGIRQRFGAIGQFGSIAVIERLILTIKTDCLRRLLVPFSKVGIEKDADVSL